MIWKISKNGRRWSKEKHVGRCLNSGRSRRQSRRGPDAGPGAQTPQCTELTIKQQQAGGYQVCFGLVLTETQEVLHWEMQTHIQLIEVISFNRKGYIHRYTKQPEKRIHTHKMAYIQANMHRAYTVPTPRPVSHSCICTQKKSTAKPSQIHACRTNTLNAPAKNITQYTQRHVVKINPFSVFIIHIALHLYLLNEMQTMEWYSWEWDHRDPSLRTRRHTALFINTQEAWLVLLPQPWLNQPSILYLIVWIEKKCTSGKTATKHHWHGYYRHTVRNTNIPCRCLFSSIAFHYASACIIRV